MAKPPDDQRLECLQGTLDMLVLRTLQWGSQHGHGIGQPIRAQSDDLLKVGGIYVAPAEIERCLATHPDVVECAVVAADQDGLVSSCAWVVLRPSAATTSEDLRTFVREPLAPHKVPREVRRVPRLARTGSGKIDRSALRLAATADMGGTQQ